MKTFYRVLLILGTALVSLGFLFSIFAMCLPGFSWSAFGHGEKVTKNHHIKEAFHSVAVEGVSCDIQVLPSTTEHAYVECKESETFLHTVEVKDGVLQIRWKDTRAWYEKIGISFGDFFKYQITVYLPAFDYESVSLKTVSGKICVDHPFAIGELRAETVSGDIYMGGLHCGALTLHSTSGKLHCQSLSVSEHGMCKTVSGDLALRDIAANTLYLESVSGEIACHFSSEMKYKVNTVSGVVHTPYDGNGGLCEIKTTSGNVHCTHGSDDHCH